MDYKNSLNLPHTDFPMRANLPKLEPTILKYWNEIGLYENKILNLDFEEEYSLHDGPPYANGDIHIGHALNKSLKDIIVKFMTMNRKKTTYLPGWDCHGLPVEYALFKKLRKTKHQVDILDFRKKAYDYAMKYVEIQKEEFKRLGVFGLWNKSYLTLDSKYESVMLESLGKLVEKGYIYRGLKPVNWCRKCETALAEAEVEYKEKESPSIYIKFPLQNQKDCYILVWTTTPWTLLGNVACAVNAELGYVKISVVKGDKRENYIIAEKLLSDLEEKTGLEYEVVGKFDGKELGNSEILHPFLDRESKLIYTDFVSGEEGTGCVHIAPGHGEEDYQVGKEYQLPMFVPVNGKGKFKTEYSNLNKDIEDKKVYTSPWWLEGKDVYKANSIIIEKLRNKNRLLFYENIAHSYPTCWRCKNSVIFRATKQWFMKIDHDNLREEIKNKVKNISWVPSGGEKRFKDMIENRPDWCLSRQRLWGVPIPALTCKDCNEDILTSHIVREVAEVVEEEGSDVWFQKSLEDIFLTEIKCPNCESKNLKKLNDIIDVWFESGVSHMSVLEERDELFLPADLYLEGNDQHRGWFQTSMITSTAITGKAPFKSVLTHGFVVDAEGKKMSKSQGNVVSPLEIFEKYGADVLRLWVVSCDYNDDIKISSQILSNVAEAYRKIRNTFKFLLGNLYDFDVADEVDYDSLLEIDRWILLRTTELIKYVKQRYNNFEFHKIYRRVYDFCILDLSSFYLNVLKDRLYIYRADSLQRRSAQTAIYYLLTTLTKIIAPIMPFTCEQVWNYLPEGIKSYHKESIHLEKLPEVKEGWLDGDLSQRWERLLNIREEILKALEVEREKGLIGSSLEAKIKFYTDYEKTYRFLDDFDCDLRYVFVVSQFELVEVDDVEEIKDYTTTSTRIKLKVDKADGKKCQRCWNYSKSVGENEEYKDICNRCIAQITDIRP